MTPLEMQKAQIEVEKIGLEARKIALENKALELQITGKQTVPRWEIIKSLVTWFGVIIPAFITVFTYMSQRQTEIEQKALAEESRRNERFNNAIARLESIDQRVAAILQLSEFGERAIPILLAEVRVEADEIHKVYFPGSTLAALGVITRLGLDKLDATSLQLLKNKTESAAITLESHLAKPTQSGSPEYLRYEEMQLKNLGLVLDKLQSIVGPNDRWTSLIEKASRLSLASTPAS